MGGSQIFGITDPSKSSASPSAKPFRVQRSARPQRLILMGTGPFAVPAFEALWNAGHEIALVVTRPAPVVKSRKGPPPSPVREFAAKHNFAVFDPESINSPQAIAHLSALRAALMVVCDYGQILSPQALSATPLGGINLHGSLLPAYRGAAPVQWAVLNGDPVAGVSVIHMTPRLDGGPILATASIPVEPSDTSGSLEEKLARLGVEPTVKSVDMLSIWDQVSPIGTEQDKSRVSRAPRLSKSSGAIDWTRSAAEIDRHVRGMQPWPGAFSEIVVNEGKPPLRVAVREIKLESTIEPIVAPEFHDSRPLTPGTIICAQHLIVATGPREQPGAVRIHRLQPAGRGEVSGDEFLRGYRLKAGACFSPKMSVES